MEVWRELFQKEGWSFVTGLFVWRYAENSFRKCGHLWQGYLHGGMQRTVSESVVICDRAICMEVCREQFQKVWSFVTGLFVWRYAENSFRKCGDLWQGYLYGGMQRTVSESVVICDRAICMEVCRERFQKKGVVFHHKFHSATIYCICIRQVGFKMQ